MLTLSLENVSGPWTQGHMAMGATGRSRASRCSVKSSIRHLSTGEKTSTEAAAASTEHPFIPPEAADVEAALAAGSSGADM